MHLLKKNSLLIKSEFQILSIIKSMKLMWYIYPFLKYKLLKFRNLILTIVSFLELVTFLYNLSKHNENNKYSFLLINNSVDLWISNLQIEHLNIGIRDYEITYWRILYLFPLNRIDLAGINQLYIKEIKKFQNNC